MNFDQYWAPKIDLHQISFRVLDVHDDGEILGRTDNLVGWVKYCGVACHVLEGVTLPDDTCDYDPYDALSNHYTSNRVPKYYRPIISGDMILYDGLTLLFGMRDNDMGFGMVNLSEVFSHETVPKMVEIFQIVKTIDFTRAYMHDEVLHEIERYMML